MRAFIHKSDTVVTFATDAGISRQLGLSIDKANFTDQ